jgi:3-oxoacyl-[acyl-carrier-protein] synthase II
MDERVEAGTDLFAQFALAGAEQAVRQAGLATFDPRRTAVVHGTSMGGMRALAKGQYQPDTSGPDAIDRKTRSSPCARPAHPPSTRSGPRPG